MVIATTARIGMPILALMLAFLPPAILAKIFGSGKERILEINNERIKGWTLCD